MKWIKIKYLDKSDLQQALNLTTFLVSLQIKSAEYAASDINEIIDNEFCKDCDSSKDYCECDMDYRSRYDYDRAYDEWKDRQL
jgi:hypothetical protein